MAGLLCLGIAMSSGGAAEFPVAHPAGFDPVVGLAPHCLMASPRAYMMCNAGAMPGTPAAMATVRVPGVDVMPVLIAVTLFDSISLLTPFRHQAGAITHAVENCRFADFTKTGKPRNLVFWMPTITFIPVFRPF